MSDIEGYEGVYAVTKEGKIWSYPRSWMMGYPLTTIRKKGIWVSLKKRNNKGYVMVTLSKNNKQKTFTVHRLVAKTFIPNPLNLAQVNHKNGNKSDNCVDNLEWCSNQQNRDHAVKTGLHRKY